MEINVVERKIVEADAHLSADDIRLCFEDPYSFAESIQERLRPLLPVAEPAPALRKPKPHQHITIGQGKTVRNGRGRKGATRVPKAPTGAKPFKCDNCGQTFGREGNLRNHQAKEHGQPGSSTPPATAVAAA